MSNHSFIELIGRNILASIGEPWDFLSEDGDGRLVGKITDVWFDKDNEPLICCRVSRFVEKSKVISDILLVNRYCSEQHLIETLLAGKPVVVNMMFRVDGKPFEQENIEKTLLDRKNVSFLIGSVTLADMEK